MNTIVPSSASVFWRRTVRVASGAALTLGLLALAPAAQAQTVYGLSQNGTVLVTASFTSLASGIAPATMPITGVRAGQTLVGLDSRPATGELFTLGYDGAGTGQLYTINKSSGVATAVGGTLALALGNANERIGFDFNPTVDRIRVTSSNDVNYRVNPVNGTVAATDGTIKFPAPSTNNPVVGAVAYTNSFQGTATTTLYDIDESRSTLYIQNPPNDGVLTAGVSITRNSLPLLTATDQTDIDIFTDLSSPNREQTTLLAVTTSLATSFYRLDLATGNASLLNGGTAGFFINDIAFGIDRTAPAASGQQLYGVTTNNSLISFFSGTPNFINSSVPITGITTGQTLVGTDFRPNTGQLFGLGYNAAVAGPLENTQLYTINLSTGVATAVGPAIRLELGGATDNIGFDFNPTVDRIRVVSTNRADFRLNPNNGALAATDGTLTYAAGDPNFGATPRIGAVAYTNSFAGSTATTLYDIDEALSILAIQSPPNAGTLNTQGGNTGLALNQANALVDLDIYSDGGAMPNQAFLTANPNGQATSNLYTLDLSTATPTLVGAVGGGIPLRDIAAFIAPLAQPALTGRLLYSIAGGTLVSFDSGNPGSFRSAVVLSGLPATQTLVGLDFRPATGELFALGYNTGAAAPDNNAQLYTVNLTTGALTAAGSPSRMELGTTATAIGFDFNPTVDRIRIVSATTQANLRVNPIDGAVIVDTPLTNPDNASAPAVAGSAYTNNDNNATTGTMLYGYDQTANVVVVATLAAGAPAGSNAANNGTYRNVGTSNVTLSTSGVDFDIFADVTNPASPVNSAFLMGMPTGTSPDNLYTVNLSSGAVTLVGRIGSGSSLTGLAAFLEPAPVVLAGLTWTGAIDTDWNKAGNWTPMQVPTATDNVNIPNVANDPVVSDPRQVNSLSLSSGATLTTANQSLLTLNGNFINNGGTVLGAGTGEVRFAGAAAQTISGTATRFQNLTASTSGGLTLNAPTSVQRVLALNAGTLTTNANLTLLSNANGTAEVVNNGSSTASGTATVQRYIDPARNAGLGYRHYSAPVTGSTVADLATPGFTPVVNPAYNTQGNTVVPFPTVFGYEESRVMTSGNPAPQDFDMGFFSPNTLNDALLVTRGYTVNIASSETVDFVGTLNNGTYNTGNLTRGAQTMSGFHLRGNPYPSAISWDAVVRNNVDATVYVYRSSGQYAGTYSTYTVNGAATNGGQVEIPVAQGFFVRANSNTADLTFNNTARITAYANPVFQRGALTAPLVRLDLRNAAGQADEAVVFFDAAATAAFDSELDAFKLLGGSPLAVASTVDASTLLAVNGLPALTSTDVIVPLRVQTTAGANTLKASELLRLPAGTRAYLQDALTGTTFDLSQPGGYSFTVAAGATATGRFSLLISQKTVLANAPSAVSQQVSVYPNPARDAVSINLPAALARKATEVQLVNSLGQVVLRATLPAGNAQPLSIAGIARGIYTVRMQTEQGTVNKRLVIE